MSRTQKEKEATIMFFRNKRNTDKYNRLLEKENESLKRKISQLEKSRDNAIKEKERSIGLLNQYKTEYETLIADARKLIEKQKNTDKAANTIMENYKKELEALQK